MGCVGDVEKSQPPSSPALSTSKRNGWRKRNFISLSISSSVKDEPEPGEKQANLLVAAGESF